MIRFELESLLHGERRTDLACRRKQGICFESVDEIVYYMFFMMRALPDTHLHDYKGYPKSRR